MLLSRTGAALRAHHSRLFTSYREPLGCNSYESRAFLDSFYMHLVNAAPSGATGSYAFKWEYQCDALLSKLLDETICDEETRAQNALNKMLISEDVCKGINQSGYTAPPGADNWLAEVLHYAQAWVADTLGDLDYSLFEFTRFSGGASTSRTRREGSPLSKYNVNHDPIDVTEAALKYFLAYVERVPLWTRDATLKLRIVPGNRVFTVPKKSDCDRCCAAEPDANMALQLAVGRHIRRALLRRGINLNDQSINQELAYLGSASGSVATIDLSSASDTISYKLVMDLLPFPWFNLLDDLRSPLGVLPTGETIVWEKFSSMGNGFTFELETLIFASIAYGVFKQRTGKDMRFGYNHNAHVYGDDIIVPTQMASNVISALQAIGFSTNHEKTFIQGPFRESCGKHYYDGVDVSPFYVRKPIDNTSRYIWLGNSLRAWAADRSGLCDPAVYPIYKGIKDLIPSILHGGKDVKSTYSLATPGNTRKRLLPEVSSKNVNGPAALLRWFQATHGRDINLTFNRYIGNPMYAGWPDDDVRAYVEYRNSVITSVTNRLARIKHRDVHISAVGLNKVLSVVPGSFSLVQNTEWGWTTIPLFSEEVAACINNLIE